MRTNRTSHSTNRTSTTIPERAIAEGVAGEDGEAGESRISPEPTLRRPKKLGSAARLPYFFTQWQQVTSNNFILKIIKYGYKIDFIKEPEQENFIPRKMTQENINICNYKVKTFLASGAIIVVQPSRDQFLSDIFPVAKRCLSDHRIILDLSELNDYVRKISFKMDSLDTIISMIRPGDYFVSIDISDAYYSIAMHILAMPFLTFIFLGIYYQFTCLPQGLTSAPRIFTRIMRVVMSHLRSRGLRISAWLDDLLLAASSASLTASQTNTTLGTLEELGFIPNYEKSVLTPAQRISHLGLIWDSIEFTVSVPSEKIQDIQSKCRTALSSRVPVRFLSSILGSIEYFRWGFPFAAVHYRLLQRFVNECLAKGLTYNSNVSLSNSAKKDLHWWANSGSSLPPHSLSPFSASLTLYSDASMKGWGGWTSEGRESFGSWSSAERELHINILEFKAVFFLFQCFFAKTYDCSIAIRTDNSTVVAYINHQGGPTCNDLCDLSLDLWKFCIKRGIMIRAYHLEGVQNVRADFLSRHAPSDHSYSLRQDIFNKIKKLLSFKLVIDCFASRLNTKLFSFISRYSDPFASGIDAFTVKWKDNIYLFPPVPIIHRVLAKFISDRVGHGLLVCPLWPSQPWFSTVLELLIAPPFLLPSDSIMDEEKRLPRHSRLLGCPIGSIPQEQRVYQGGLQSVGCGALRWGPLSSIKNIGANFIIGSIANRQVTVELL